MGTRILSDARNGRRFYLKRVLSLARVSDTHLLALEARMACTLKAAGQSAIQEVEQYS